MGYTRIPRKSRTSPPGGVPASFLLLFLLLLPNNNIVSSQNLLTSDPPTASPTSKVCSCSPSIYRFSLNFSVICPPPGIRIGNFTGVDQYFCRVFSANDDDSDDLVPVVVTSYAIFELDSTLKIIKQFFREGLQFQNGDNFEYTSITATGKLDSEKIPSAFQMEMEGVNANGNEVVSQWIVDFSNKCHFIPFQEGDFMSWVVFEELVPARPELCDVRQEPTVSPTYSPNALTLAPYISPTVPEVKPPEEPTETPEPTILSTKKSTEYVTPLPTKMPKADPTPLPAKKPTKPGESTPTPPPMAPAETPDPTASPTQKSIKNISMSPTKVPNGDPTSSSSKNPSKPDGPTPSSLPTVSSSEALTFKPLPKQTPKPSPKPWPTPADMSMSQAYVLSQVNWDMLDPKDFRQSEGSKDGGKHSGDRKLFKRNRIRGGRRFLREGLADLNVHVQ